MLKRLTDFFSNLGVASLAIGLYKDGDSTATAMGLVFFGACMMLARLEGRQ